MEEDLTKLKNYKTKHNPCPKIWFITVKIEQNNLFMDFKQLLKKCKINKILVINKVLRNNHYKLLNQVMLIVLCLHQNLFLLKLLLTEMNKTRQLCLLIDHPKRSIKILHSEEN